MKSVIFGGGGFVGSAIANRLLKEGQALKIIGRPRVEHYWKFTANERVE